MQNKTLMAGPLFGKILLATDFSPASEAAFQAAIQLCLAFKAKLYVLNVFKYARLNPLERGGQILELDSFYQKAETSLDTLMQTARRAGVHCRGSIGTGIAHATILATLKTQGSDLLVLGTRSIHGFERLVFGSTAEAVLRQAGCPVFTVGPQATPKSPTMQDQGGVVLFATDFHTSTTDALPYAISFCKFMKMPLHCLHILPKGVEDGSHKEVMSYIILEALQHLLSGVEIEVTPVCAVTYGSEVSTAIVEYARKHKARLIVLGVRRASLMTSHVPAHISYRVITDAPCPVLTIAFPTDFLEKSLPAIAENSPLTCRSSPSSAGPGR